MMTTVKTMADGSKKNYVYDYTTVTLGKQVHQQLKVYCAVHDITVREAVDTAILALIATKTQGVATQKKS